MIQNWSARKEKHLLEISQSFDLRSFFTQKRFSSLSQDISESLWTWCRRGRRWATTPRADWSCFRSTDRPEYEGKEKLSCKHPISCMTESYCYLYYFSEWTKESRDWRADTDVWSFIPLTSGDSQATGDKNKFPALWILYNSSKNNKTGCEIRPQSCLITADKRRIQDHLHLQFLMKQKCLKF